MSQQRRTIKYIVPLIFCCISIITVCAQQADTDISNSSVIVRFDSENGTFSVLNKKDSQESIRNAIFKLNQYVSTREGAVNSVEIKNSGKTKTLIVTNSLEGEPTLLFKAELELNENFVVLSTGILNSTDENLRLMSFSVLEGEIFPELKERSNVKIVDGNAGGGKTKVTDSANFNCYNNALITFKNNEKRYTLVAGGISYQDFEKKIEIKDHKHLKVFADDYVGKLVLSGETYWASNDKFYLDILTSNPFHALEKYGFALRAYQNVKLNHYTFPSVCMWYVNFDHYGGKTGVNDSPGVVEEMRRIKESGFLNYSGTAAVRLVPDNYGYNNQQSWWDNEHYSKLGSPFHTEVKGGHLKAPYETLAKLGKAVTSLGGLPLLYFQSNWRSEDYAAQHPDQMLFNKSYARRDDPFSTEEIKPEMHVAIHPPCEARNRKYYGHDYTDINFSKHMKEVYSGMGKSKIAGLMYDYPWSGWADKGGMDDTTITATANYRRMYQLAKQGLGKVSWVHERNIEYPSDVSLGLVDSQRTMWDNDKLTPGSVTKSGLRWYKNRVVISYDADAKNLLTESKDELRKILTMSYVTTGRLLLGVSFGAMSKETIHDLSRIYPFHSKPQSARPIDAFVNEIPEIYDFQVNDDWHQLTLYNTDSDNKFEIKVALSGEQADGKLGLNPEEEYYAYDFWNDEFAGKLNGTGELKQTLRPDEARMLSIRKVQSNPQVISTNRHIMQGMLDLSDCKWNSKKKKLTGTSKVVGNDQYVIVIATNGYNSKMAKTSDGKCKIEKTDKNLIKLIIDAKTNQSIDWCVSFR